MVYQKPSIVQQHTENAAVRFFIKTSCPGSSRITQQWAGVSHRSESRTVKSFMFSSFLLLLQLIKCYFCLIELHDSSQKRTDQPQYTIKIFLRFLSHSPISLHSGLGDLTQSNKDFGYRETWVTQEKPFLRKVALSLVQVFTVK